MDLRYLMVNCPTAIDLLVKSGDFKGAEKAIQRRLSLDCPPLLRKRLEHELMSMKLIRRDFTVTGEMLFEELSSHIKGLTRIDVARFDENDSMLWHMVDGEKRYHKRAVKTILKEHAVDEEREVIDKAISHMKAAGKSEVVITLEASLTLDEKVIERAFESRGIEDDGIRHLHLPIPRCEHFTKMLEMQVFTKGEIHISKPNHPQRTVYAKANKGQKHHIKYTFKNDMDYLPVHELSEFLEAGNQKLEMLSSWPKVLKDEYPFLTAEMLTQGEESSEAGNEMTQNDPKLSRQGQTMKRDVGASYYLSECPPHILFTPLLREIADQIVDFSDDALLKARKIYDYITMNLKYTFMSSYRALINIPEFGALNLKGDCGVQALLFITLCRIAGVPATFASGLMSPPGNGVGMHDWAAFYTPELGWRFVDTSYGESAYKHGLMNKWKFYFGNLDPYRAMHNFDFQVPFEHPKKYLRDDPYDNQVGEAETNAFGLYSEHYHDNVWMVSIEEE